MLKSVVSCQGTVPDQLALLEEEIAVLERRLDDMGMDGDCAYERAISKVYINLVASRKQQLAALTPAPGR